MGLGTAHAIVEAESETLKFCCSVVSYLIHLSGYEPLFRKILQLLVGRHKTVAWNDIEFLFADSYLPRFHGDWFLSLDRALRFKQFELYVCDDIIYLLHACLYNDFSLNQIYLLVRQYSHVSLRFVVHVDE